MTPRATLTDDDRPVVASVRRTGSGCTLSRVGASLATERFVGAPGDEGSSGTGRPSGFPSGEVADHGGVVGDEADSARGPRRPFGGAVPHPLPPAGVSRVSPRPPSG
ncbi:hypothetical protein DU504_03135 [Haloplanus salinus]|uniref:Uncharacterized protein n=1 Tax=Haloplanus salinus TaxID=1126245 RepID=A0A368NAT1_9EURY|nr:hypothetical protein [Haloplanus salinus]RCU46389.1 hypothetical protein DU504_03135 [Haloplanus salinus]